MWQAAQPVARKFPLRAFAGVQRWQEVHSFLRRSKKTSPDSLNVGSGSSPLRAPGGCFPLAQGAGCTGIGVIAKCTSSRVGWSPLGNSVPDWVPERWAMIEAFTAWVIVLWQKPQVWSTTRRSDGFAHIPA